MTEKRIFNADCESDVKELFALVDTFYTGVIKIRKGSSDDFFVELSNKNITEEHYFQETLSFQINWNGKTEIVRPVEIKVGMFGKFYNNPYYPTYGYISYVDMGLYFIRFDDSHTDYKVFIPITQSEWEEIGKANGFIGD